MPKYDINIDKIYSFPSQLSIINYNGYIIVIAPQFANWIVLLSDKQLSVFQYLAEGKTIKEAIDNPQFNYNDINYVVSQIEARRLCTKHVHSSVEGSRNLHLYLTNKCNLLCPHCYMFSGKANENELTTEEVINLLHDYKTIAHGTRLTLSGGEPTVHTDFDKIVRIASNLGFEVKLLTNGTLLTSERVELIAGYISSVQISIDGYSEETDKQIRGAEHFCKALNAVDYFINHGIETSIAITASLESLRGNPDGFVRFAKKMMAKYEGKPFEVKFAEGLSAGRNIQPSDKSNEEYSAIINSIQKKIYGEQYDLITFVDTMSRDVILNNCMFGIFSISSTGDVYFCPDLGNLLPVANIRTTPFTEICELSQIAENMTDVQNLQPCNKCELKYICGGGCRTKEFPELVKRLSFENINYKEIPPRICTNSTKERFYKLMVESNEYLFTSFDEESN